MTWPTSQIAEGSAAQVYQRITSDAFQAKQSATSLRTLAQAGQLTPAMLRRALPQIRAARVYLVDNAATAGVQAYARLVSGVGTFDLAAEATALATAYGNVIAAGRALHNASIGTVDANGDVADPLDTIPAVNAAAFVAALQALEAAIA